MSKKEWRIDGDQSEAKGSFLTSNDLAVSNLKSGQLYVGERFEKATHNKTCVKEQNETLSGIIPCQDSLNTDAVSHSC